MEAVFFTGLCSTAKAFLEGETLEGAPENKVAKSFDPDVEVTGEAFLEKTDVGFVLFRYVYPDGSCYVEEVQDRRRVISGGGSEEYLFLALKGASGEWITPTLWTDEEMTMFIIHN